MIWRCDKCGQANPVKDPVCGGCYYRLIKPKPIPFNEKADKVLGFLLVSAMWICIIAFCLLMYVCQGR